MWCGGPARPGSGTRGPAELAAVVLVHDADLEGLDLPDALGRGPQLDLPVGVVVGQVELLEVAAVLVVRVGLDGDVVDAVGEVAHAERLAGAVLVVGVAVPVGQHLPQPEGATAAALAAQV